MSDDSYVREKRTVDDDTVLIHGTSRCAYTVRNEKQLIGGNIEEVPRCWQQVSGRAPLFLRTKMPL